jgi:hypothetical protein
MEEEEEVECIEEEGYMHDDLGQKEEDTCTRTLHRLGCLIVPWIHAQGQAA